MKPTHRTDLLVALFAYQSHVLPDYPDIIKSNSPISPEGLINFARDWFLRVLMAERPNLPPGAAFDFDEFRICSGERHLFKVHGIHYDKIIIVIGAEKTYWIFFNIVPLTQRVQGMGTLPLVYCSCCFKYQYRRIMRIIKAAFQPPQFV